MNAAWFFFFRRVYMELPGWLSWTLGLGSGAALLAALAWLYRRYLRATNGWPWQWLRTVLGRGKNLTELARRLGMDSDALRQVEPRYKETHIPKKRGGMRKLLIPDPPLKLIQRRILHRLLRRLRAHAAAMGFERGKSMVHNALPHVGHAIVIKLDIVDFFPKTTAVRIEAYFRRVGWNAEAAALLTRLCTHDGGLPQGAPTSPRLANLVNFLFDSRITRHVQQRKGVYTRYADDLTISFPKDHPRKVRGIIQKVRRVAKSLGYTIHTRGKLRVVRAHQQQRVTGLVVNRKVQLPRKTRRRLRAIAHHLATGRDATLLPAQLAGWQCLEHMIARQAAMFEA